MNGTVLETCADRAVFEADGSCAWLVEDGGRVWVKYSSADHAATVVISPRSR